MGLERNQGGEGWQGGREGGEGRGVFYGWFYGFFLLTVFFYYNLEHERAIKKK